MKPTTCRDVCEHASVVLAGEPTGPEWEAVRDHLERCPPCGEYLRQLGLTVEALRMVPGTCGEAARAELLNRFEAWMAQKTRSTP